MPTPLISTKTKNYRHHALRYFCADGQVYLRAVEVAKVLGYSSTWAFYQNRIPQEKRLLINDGTARNKACSYLNLTDVLEVLACHGYDSSKIFSKWLKKNLKKEALEPSESAVEQAGNGEPAAPSKTGKIPTLYEFKGDTRQFLRIKDVCKALPHLNPDEMVDIFYPYEVICVGEDWHVSIKSLFRFAERSSDVELMDWLNACWEKVPEEITPRTELKDPYAVLGRVRSLIIELGFDRDFAKSLFEMTCLKVGLKADFQEILGDFFREPATLKELCSEFKVPVTPPAVAALLYAQGVHSNRFYDPETGTTSCMFNHAYNNFGKVTREGEENIKTFYYPDQFPNLMKLIGVILPDAV